MVRLQGLGKLKEFNYLIRTQSREPSALPSAALDIPRRANKIYRPLSYTPSQF
jgi:hypothetical protein